MNGTAAKHSDKGKNQSGQNRKLRKPGELGAEVVTRRQPKITMARQPLHCRSNKLPPMRPESINQDKSSASWTLPPSARSPAAPAKRAYRKTREGEMISGTPSR